MLVLVLKNEMGCNLGEYPINTSAGVTEGVVQAIKENHVALVEGDSLEIKEAHYVY